MSSHTLVGTPFSTFTRTIALALHHKSIPFTQLATKPHEPLAKEHHPFGFLPTLVIHGADGKDVRLCESQAIARYIDRVAPEPSLHAAKLAVPEKMWELVSLCASLGTSSFTRSTVRLSSCAGFPRFEVGVIKVRAGMAGAPEAEIQTKLESGLSKLREFIAVLDTLMAPSGFAFASHPTWADFFLYPLVADLEATPEAHVLSQRLVEWSAQMKTLPAVGATVKGTMADVERK
jgi:glutathione S-transferase